MEVVSELGRRLLILFRLRSFDRDLEDEMRLHLELREREQREAGLSPEEARYAAKRRFGNTMLLKEVSREMWGWSPLEQLLQDVRYGLRTMLRNPGFTAVALLTLALGIGANTAIFSVVNTVLLRPLPFRDPDSLVMVWEQNRRIGRTRNAVSPANYLDWKAQNRVFAEMSAVIESRPTLTGAGEPEEIPVQEVNASFFPMLGVRPILERTFSSKEERPGAARVAVLSHQLWLRRFGGDPAVVGRAISLSNESVTVIGVLGPGFRFLGRRADLWLAARFDPAINYRQRAGRFMGVVARLNQGVSLDQAQLEMDGIARRMEHDHPDFNTNWGVNLVPLHEQYVGGIRRALQVLLGAVAFVLLIACANVANLLLARAATREKEMAIRTSLGAGPWRMVRQLLTESCLLAFLGGGAGVLLALWTVDLLKAANPSNVPRLEEVHLDLRVLGFTFLLSLAAGITFGLAPALTALRTSLKEVLKEGGRSAPGGPRGHRLRNSIVVAEVALALVLSVGAGLMMRSFFRLQAVDPGFQPHDVLTLTVSLPRSIYREPQQLVDFFQQAVEKIARLPGVRSAGAITFLPFSGPGSATSLYVVGRPMPAPGEFPVTDVCIVHPDYFRTMGIPFLKGRNFTAQDYRLQAPRTFLVNETMVRWLFPNEDPLGKSLVVEMEDSNPPGQIIGVVADVKHAGLDGEVRPMVYYPHPHLPMSFMTFVVRSTSEPRILAPAVTGVIRGMDPNLPVSDVKTMEEWLGESVAQPRFNMVLLGLFSALALALAAVGIYGVMSYAVSQQTHEIGIRMALGAAGGDVLCLVLGKGLVLALVGVYLGLALALASTQVLATLLFSVKATDPATFAGTALLLIAVSFLACYFPARRATRVDPMVALRYE